MSVFQERSNHGDNEASPRPGWGKAADPARHVICQQGIQAGARQEVSTGNVKEKTTMYELLSVILA